MLSYLWLLGLVRHRWRRVIGVAACVALAVALIASLGSFITLSSSRMTTQAIAGVPVDWQVELVPGTNPTVALKTIEAVKGVREIRQAGYGDVAAFTATTGPTVQVTGAGKILGVPADYAATFPGEVRYLSGAKAGVLVAQQTAANLQIVPGDSVSAKLPDGRSVSLRVDGVIDLPQADSLFQIVGAPPGAGATAPPDNVIIAPLPTWERLFAPLAASRPDTVRTQFHLNLGHELPASPAAAFNEVVSRAHNLEARLAGAGKVGNNLAVLLDAARSDAVYAELLFLFLGLPGIVLACLLTAIAGAAGHERRRREQALLRIRGASPARILGFAVAESLLVAVVGVALGIAGAVASSAAAFGLPQEPLATAGTLPWAAIAGAAGLALAVLAITLPALRDARLLSVRTAQQQVAAARLPLWGRLYLDIGLLAAAGVIFWQSMSNAYQVVLVPEGVPTISINYLTLLAPMMFLTGFALLTWRLSDVMLRRAPGAVASLLRPVPGRLSGTVAASMARQRRLLSRGLVLIALAIAFAFSVAIFNTTYTNQARVDAQLTNGADVSVTGGDVALAPDLPQRVKGLAGVVAAEPMQHRFAYVGNDLQDLYGIDPRTIERATPMSDAFFGGGSAAAVLGRLADTNDGILVSEETVNDFQLQPGDLVRIRLQGPDHAYHVVPFHYVGVAREFPTAPHDSFLVANSAYIAKATGIPGFETLLIRTSRSPRQVASDVRRLLGPTAATSVHDLESELKTTLSSLTAINLTGLTRLELSFAVIMAIASSGLILALGFVERRRSFAILHALGARRNQLGSFVWSEALFTALGGVSLGALGGWLEAFIVVKILTGVFDPPPEGLSIPGVYIGVVLVSVAVSIAVAASLAIRAAAKPALEVIRDL